MTGKAAFILSLAGVFAFIVTPGAMAENGAVFDGPDKEAVPSTMCPPWHDSGAFFERLLHDFNSSSGEQILAAVGEEYPFAIDEEQLQMLALRINKLRNEFGRCSGYVVLGEVRVEELDRIANVGAVVYFEKAPVFWESTLYCSGHKWQILLLRFSSDSVLDQASGFLQRASQVTRSRLVQ